MNCEFCKTVLKNISALNLHKKTAKYCLKIQLGETKKEPEIFKCVSCNKILKTKKILNIHKLSCAINIENESLLKKKMDDLDLENNEIKKELNQLKIKNITLNEEITNQKIIIAKLETKLETRNEIYNKDHDVIIDLAKQPKNTNTTNNKILITQPIDLSVERLANIIDTKYTNILGGQKALAEFTADEILKDINGKIQYLCTDISRQNFKYMNDKNEICNDPQSTILISKLCEAGIKHKANEIANIMWTKEDGTVDSDQFVKISTPLLEIMSVDYEDSNSNFRKELSKSTNVK